jgi:hypothetical protein
MAETLLAKLEQIEARDQNGYAAAEPERRLAAAE